MEKFFREYIPVPLARRRDPQSIRTFYNMGLKQKRDLVRALSKFEDDQYYQQLYTVTTTVAKNPSSGFHVIVNDCVYVKDQKLTLYLMNRINTFLLPSVCSFSGLLFLFYS